MIKATSICNQGEFDFFTIIFGWRPHQVNGLLEMPCYKGRDVGAYESKRNLRGSVRN